MISSQSLRLSSVVFMAGLALSACQSNDSSGVLNVTGSDGQPQKITAEELLAFCPSIGVRDGGAFFNSYEKGGDADATKLIYQASISDTTRACSFASGTMTINVAIAGRVVMGPVGKAGTVNLPIRVSVTRGEEVLYSQLNQHSVNIAAGSTQFMFNDPSAAIASTNDRNVRITVGFEQGPAPKRNPAE